MTVTQSSARGVVNWQGFSIGSGNTVQFNNGSGATLNRVTGGDPSQIMGTLKATGSVYVVNPHGVVIGESGVVATGGSFVATTLNVPDDRFMAGGDTGFAGDSKASVVNLGKISSTGGDVALIAREVVNRGEIRAPKGSAVLASGSEVLLKEKGDGEKGGGERVYVRAGSSAGSVETSGLIESAQAELKAAGGNVYALAGNNGGVVRATGAENRGGRVWLSATGGNGAGGHVVTSGTVTATNADGGGGAVSVSAPDGMAMHTGTLSASGTTGGTVAVQAKTVINQGRVSADGTAGRGGRVALTASGNAMDTTAARTSAKGSHGGGAVTVAAGGSVFLSGQVDVTGTGGAGGTADVFGTDTVRLVGASVDASGRTVGGTIRVGGDYQGQGDVPKARQSILTPATTLTADGLVAAGRVIVWSQERTEFAGLIFARGGDGFVEVSSKDALAFAGAVTADTLLLDPKNITISDTGSYPSFALANPNPGTGITSVVVLPNGNVVVSNSNDTAGGAQAGAVYLFNGATGALISTLTGSRAADQVGLAYPTILSNGNYVLRSSTWDNGTVVDAGAVTWGSATSGVAGVVSVANSLVGTAVSDAVGSFNPLVLSNGNYVVTTSNWANGTQINAGAVTWGNGTTGVSGAISAANSVVGSHAGDQVGSTNPVELDSGNVVFASPSWTNGTEGAAGAVTWMDGATGLTGTISASNSLIGTAANSRVGSGGITKLSNGHFVIASPNWGNGTLTMLGAVTWGNGTTGITGTVSAANSLIGASNDDTVGLGNPNTTPNVSGVNALGNGNYVVISPYWKNGTVANAGAVTWRDGSTANGATGAVVGSANSVIGALPGDQLGSGGFLRLTNDNWVVSSTVADRLDTAVTVSDVGVVTWGSGTAGRTGVVDSTNSLMGTSTGDKVGGSLIALTNGNYVTRTGYWRINASTTDVGAVTWGNGTTGTTGLVSAANSLVGTRTGDAVGGNTTTSARITPLASGNFVVISSGWDNGTVANAGAVTWGDGAGGTTIGTLDGSNSLVGSSSNDQVGNLGITELTNGNFVVRSSLWKNVSKSGAGAVTWMSGTARSAVGAITSSNSVIGSTTNDAVGSKGITALSDGNYLILSPSWDNGTIANAGAITWGNGTTGFSGELNSGNSLVGTRGSDQVGNSTPVDLGNGNYVFTTTGWDYVSGAITITDAGAVTWFSTAGTFPTAITTANSVIGAHNNDKLGSGGITALPNGNYVVLSRDWGNGTSTKLGAVTWFDGSVAPTIGTLSAANSLIGSRANDQVRQQGLVILRDGNYVITSRGWDYVSGGTTITDAGAVTWGSATGGITGVVSAANSIIGTEASTSFTVTEAGANGNGFIAYSTTKGTVYSSAFDNALIPFGLGNGDMTLSTAYLNNTLSAGTSITLQASNDITVNNAISASKTGANIGALTLQAGRSILLNAGITITDGDLTLTANETLANGVVDAQRDAGAAAITMASGASINLGSGTLSMLLSTGLGKTYATSGAITLRDITAGTLSVLNRGPTAGSDVILNGTLTASGAGDAVVLAADNGVFTNNTGAGAISPGTGRFLIYSSDSTTTTLGSLSTGTALYSKTYTTYDPSSVTETGNRILYANASPLPPPPPPPVSPPVSPPPPPPVSPPVSPPPSPPVSPPVSPPPSPPVSPPVSPPPSPPVSPPVSPPPSPPVSPPVSPPPSPPVSPPVSPPLSPPVSPPVSPPPSPPVSPPVSPPPSPPPSPPVSPPPPVTVLSPPVIGGTVSVASSTNAVSLPIASVPQTAVSASTSASSTSSAAIPASTAATPVTAGLTGQVMPAVSAAASGNGIVTVQVSASAAPGQAAAALPAGTRVEASVSAGGFNVVYSQSASQAAASASVPGPSAAGAPAPAGGGSVSAKGEGSTAALASASSFNTFKAEETPNVSLVEDRQQSTSAAGPAGRREPQGGGS
ncbi:filamentous hemagglutinin family protein [Azospirillum fermentarium]|nr:filamentous hemagglutinin family protein [Azospirillum fermentarium]